MGTVGLEEHISTEALVACNYFPCLHDKQTFILPHISSSYVKSGMANDDKPA